MWKSEISARLEPKTLGIFSLVSKEFNNFANKRVLNFALKNINVSSNYKLRSCVLFNEAIKNELNSAISLNEKVQKIKLNAKKVTVYHAEFKVHTEALWWFGEDDQRENSDEISKALYMIRSFFHHKSDLIDQPQGCFRIHYTDFNFLHDEKLYM